MTPRTVPITTRELRAKLDANYSKIQHNTKAMSAIVSAAEAEGRDLSRRETVRFDELEDENSRLRSIGEQLASRPVSDPQPEPRKIRPWSGSSSSTRNTHLLGREQRMVDTEVHQRSLAGSSFSDEEAREFSLGRFVRGVVTNRWDDAELEKRALGENTNAAGGYLLPAPVAGYVIDLARAQAQVLNAGATTIAMDAETLAIPRLTTDVVPTWRQENTAVNESDPAFDRVTLKAKTLAVLTRVSYELFEDMPAGVSDVVTNSMTRAIGLKLDYAALRGSGIDPEPLGIKNTTGVPIQSLGTNGASPTYGAVVNAVAAIEAANHDPNAVIYSSRTAKELSVLVDTLGQPLRQPPLLDDLEFLISNQVPNTLTQGTSTTASEIYVGDWSDLIIGVRPSIAVRINTSDQRYLDSMQVGVLAYLRADITVRHPDSFAVVVGVN